MINYLVAGQKLKIIVVVDTFPPANSSTAIQMNDLVNQYIADEHEVVVITQDSSLEQIYSVENKGSLKIFRVKIKDRKGTNYALRVIIEFFAPFRIVSSLKKNLEIFDNKKFDIIVWYVPTIFNTHLITYLKRYFTCKVYLIQRDIFPDWLVDLSIIKKGAAYHVLNAFCKYQYKFADRIGVQTPSNLNIIESKITNHDVPVEVLHNWLTPPKGAASSPATIRLIDRLKNKKVFVYAGNMGVAQNMESLIEIAQYFDNKPDYLFLFIGRGSMFQKLEQTARDQNTNNIIVSPSVPHPELIKILQYCHIGLISLDPRHKTDNIPGKMLTYLFSGLPILARCNQGSDLIELVDREAVGFATDLDDIVYICDEAQLILQKIENSKEYKAHCRRTAERLFSTKATADQILKIVQF